MFFYDVHFYFIPDLLSLIDSPAAPLKVALGVVGVNVYLVTSTFEFSQHSRAHVCET